MQTNHNQNINNQKTNINHEIILETKNLSFQDFIHYQDISIISNQSNFIIGESGTGKSTLLRLFNGTLPQSEGSILYKGMDILELNTIDLRKEVLLISQSVFLFDMSIKDNFNQFYEYRSIPVISSEEMQKYLNICCVPFPLDKDCTTMSGGERQRVYMAIYLSFHPTVLMLDEPTSALDKQNSVNVMKNIMTYCNENQITVVVVSHDPALTETYADNIITIEKRGV
jgi:putative ABC transport system ATP-binding protein